MPSKTTVEQAKSAFIPKGTRVKIQGCPFYLAEDTKIQDSCEDSQRILNGVLAEEKADMDERKAQKQSRLLGGHASEPVYAGMKPCLR